MTDPAHRIVIVGGGSGGLKLATRLGDRYQGDPTVEITLIDGALTHIWKPLLHEIAAGTLDAHDNEREYMAHGRAHHFRFTWGWMEGLDRSAQQVWLAPLREDDGSEALPRRPVPYDTLVFAVGSVSNDFGVPGVAEHCYTLARPSDSTASCWKRICAPSSAPAHSSPVNSTWPWSAQARPAWSWRRSSTACGGS